MSKKDKLKEYQKKRDFEKTKEPKGDQKKSHKKPLFVIQKHDATNLHYDFRIEIEGVLASWAIPKGPSTNPSVKRLAMKTENHPLKYANFEGVIPKGEYGAGAVIIWDKGTYKNQRKDGKNMTESLKDGKIEIFLQGKKLKGGYALIKTGSKKNNGKRWLLIKKSDDYADARRNPTSTEPKSVKSGKTLKQIKKEHEQNSKKSS